MLSESDLKSIARGNIQDLWSALRLVRDELEQHAVIPPEVVASEPLKDAEILVQAIADLVASYEQRIRDLEDEVGSVQREAWEQRQQAESRVRRIQEVARLESESASLREADMRRKAQREEDDRVWNRLLGRR